MPLRRTVPSALALALAVVACSGDDGSADRGSPPPAAEAATTTTAPAFSGAGSERFCELAAEADEAVRRIPAVESRDALRDMVTSAVDAVGSLVDAAPPEIEADVRTLATAYDRVHDGLQEAEWDPSRFGPETEDELNRPEVRAASERLQSYERQVCGRS